MFDQGNDIDIAHLPPLPVFEHVPSAPENISNPPTFTRRADLQSAEDKCQAGNVFDATSCIQQLLHAGVSLQDFQGCLRRAVQQEDIHMVKMLIEAGVDVDQETIKIAIANESSSILSLFLGSGWNINEQEAWCIPALLAHAIRLQASDFLLRWFLENGADPNAPCDMDITPLSYAVNEAKFAVVHLLFNHCPPGTKYRGQLLHWAASREVSSDCELVMHLVLERAGSSMNVNAVQYEGQPFPYEMQKVVGLGTALHEAVKMGRISTVNILLNKGADVSVRNTRGETALEVARKEGNKEVEELLERIT